jgi:hypothetical protein
MRLCIAGSVPEMVYADKTDSSGMTGWKIAVFGIFLLPNTAIQTMIAESDNSKNIFFRAETQRRGELHSFEKKKTLHLDLVTNSIIFLRFSLRENIFFSITTCAAQSA